MSFAPEHPPAQPGRCVCHAGADGRSHRREASEFSAIALEDLGDRTVVPTSMTVLAGGSAELLPSAKQM